MIRDSQVLAKLGVVTIFFIGGGGGGGITKSLPGVYYLKLDINLIVHIGFSLVLRKIYIYISYKFLPIT